MLSEKELISKLQELREIKPQAEWASLTKTRILGTEPSFSFWKGLTSPYLLRPAFVSLVVAFVFLTGLYGFAKNSLPGDALYSIKRMTERGQSVFVSDQEKPQFNLNLASKRLEELTKIAQENRTKNMASAIIEVRESVAKASKDLSGDPVIIKKTVDKMEEKVQAISALGVVVGEEEEFSELRQGSDKLYFEYLISDLKTRTLTEKQEEILIEMEELAEKKDYSQALILYAMEFNNQVVNEDVEEIEDEEELDIEEEEKEEEEEIINDEEEIKE